MKGHGGSAILLAMLNLDLPLVYEPITSVSKRVFFLVVCLFGCLNLNIYGAGLTSALTYEINIVPIKTLSDLVQNPR